MDCDTGTVIQEPWNEKTADTHMRICSHLNHIVMLILIILIQSELPLRHHPYEGQP